MNLLVQEGEGFKRGGADLGRFVGFSLVAVDNGEKTGLESNGKNVFLEKTTNRALGAVHRRCKLFGNVYGVSIKRLTWEGLNLRHVNLSSSVCDEMSEAFSLTRHLADELMFQI